MSKVKFSFSLIIAFLLVGILSTAAFAKDPYGLKPAQNGLGLDVPFTGNSTDAADITGRSFDLVLLDGTTIISTTQATLDATKKGKVNYAAGVLTPGKTYTVVLYHTDDTTHATKLSSSTALVQDAHNTNMYQTPDSHVDLDGSGYKNANSTGFNNTRKNRTGQKVHGFYQNNTNSCASCHQTHTGADDNLLFKDGVYSTCSACHDGTTGAYNSFAPVSEENAHSIAGTFNVQASNHNGSLHEADGSLKVSAAPGGNFGATSGQFTQEFDCASCHAPHGNGSAGASGENNLNLDPLGWGSVQYRAEGTTYTVKVNNVDTTVTATKDDANGKLFKDLTIQTSVPTTFSTPYILVKSTLANQAAVDANFFYKRAMGTVTGPVDVIQTYRWNNSKYVADYSLWLQEKGYPYKADTILKDSTDADITRATGMIVVWRDGFAYGTQVANVTTATISIGVDVETTENMRTLFDAKATDLTFDDEGNTIYNADKTVKHIAFIPDSGTQMSKYCSACHTDYLSTTRKDNTGVYTTAHRHKTGADELTCVRCHFGHGSEAQIMKTANDETYYDLTEAGAKFDASVTGNAQLAIDYLKDPNPSSALKRYTGMAVCYACHGQGAQFLSNPNNVDRPLSGQPGAVRGQ
ncbi:cytochrome c3 family protein [Neobacillus sp. PS3-34]|uniref:cytochrome c3 family protein n=1 Tax=Neobacillus sp. PS3-34 TaxID=3070678 RepID=UPI0027DFF387|nr:cytochrome c3 family protein [Neobacillus sp. PS3-34]WML46916.1 cytochrome c3 family protein [Neobacillus sp. PS3-34]